MEPGLLTYEVELGVCFEEADDERAGERGEPVVAGEAGGDGVEHKIEQVLLAEHGRLVPVVPVKDLPPQASKQSSTARRSGEAQDG